MFKCLLVVKERNFYDEKDFDVAHFSSGWFVCYDRLGGGCKVNFPINLYSKIQWLPVVYTKDECGTIGHLKNCVIYQLVKYVVDFYLVFISIYHTIFHWSLSCVMYGLAKYLYPFL